MFLILGLGAEYLRIISLIAPAAPRPASAPDGNTGSSTKSEVLGIDAGPKSTALPVEVRPRSLGMGGVAATLDAPAICCILSGEYFCASITGSLVKNGSAVTPIGRFGSTRG